MNLTDDFLQIFLKDSPERKSHSSPDCRERWWEETQGKSA